MSDGWALQLGTSHHLGQNFTRAYGITYTDRDNVQRHPHHTSWALSTRVIGGLIMAHGDDLGLVMPPRVAPIQVVVVPVVRSNDPEGSAAVEEACRRIEAGGGDVRLRVDRREGIRPGEKYAHWELRGVPLRLTVGVRDLADGRVTVTRRFDGESWTEPVDGVAGRLPALLQEAHERTWDRAWELLQERSVEVRSLDGCAGPSRCSRCSPTPPSASGGSARMRSPRRPMRSPSGCSAGTAAVSRGGASPAASLRPRSRSSLARTESGERGARAEARALSAGHAAWPSGPTLMRRHLYSCIRVFVYSRVFAYSRIRLYSRIRVFACIRVRMKMSSPRGSWSRLDAGAVDPRGEDRSLGMRAPTRIRPWARGALPV